MSDVPSRLLIQNQNMYTNVRSLNIYDFMLHTYDGSFGYKDGSYYIPHPREAFYEDRRNRCLYKNVFKRVIDAMIVPVYSSEIIRKTGSPLFEAFLENVDVAGTKMNMFAQTAIRYARLFGVSFVVVDNFMAQETDTVIDTIAKRDYPYAYIKIPQEVVEYACNKFGRITSITFYDTDIFIDGKRTQQFRRWTDTTWELLIKGKDKEYVVISSGVNQLGKIPIIPILDFCSTKNLIKMPMPPFYDLANLCYSLFNKESELDTLELAQCFSIFYTSGVEVQTVGPHNYINCSTDSKFPPGFASPNPANHDNLMKSCDRLLNNIYTLASQNGIKIANVVKESGVSKEWDFRAEQVILNETAHAGEDLEEEMADLFFEYLNQPVDYEVEYPEDYSPSYKKDKVAEILTILESTPPQPITDRLWQDFSMEYWGEAMEIEEIPEPEPEPVVEPVVPEEPVAEEPAE